MDETGSSETDGTFRLSGRLAPERCVVIDCADKSEVLGKLIDLLASAPGVGCREELLQGILRREKLMSTGIGSGIAIPHVRLASVSDLTAAAALIRSGVADYQSPDSVPVRLAVMIAARTDQHELYLRVLSHLSTRLRDDAFRMRLFDCAGPLELCSCLGGC